MTPASPTSDGLSVCTPVNFSVWTCFSMHVTVMITSPTYCNSSISPLATAYRVSGPKRLGRDDYNSFWLFHMYRRRKRVAPGARAPLEIILLYCATPAVLVRLAWPTYFMRTHNATSHCEWQNRAWSIEWQASFGHFFILLLYLREKLTLVYLSECLQGGVSTTLSTIDK